MAVLTRARPLEKAVRLPIGAATLEGDLAIPEDAEGIVLFAHGSGSSRHSPRNRMVARALREDGLATLLMDLLTPPEETIDNVTRHLRFDIPLLAERVAGAADWLMQNPATGHLKIGYFGASTGAAATLVAATERSEFVRAIVSRGGRPDLAMRALPRIQAPTLLIVGENDSVVVEMNREAFRQIRAEKRLEIVAGASHLFEEPGTLEEVTRLASEWFQRYLTEDSEYED